MFNKVVFKMSNWVFYSIKLSFFFLIINLPTYFLMTNFLFTRDLDEINTLIISLLVLIPFLIFPSVYAANSLLRNSLKNKQINYSLIWKDVKQNFFMIVKTGIVYAILSGCLISVIESLFLIKDSLMLIFVVLYFIITLYFFIVLSYMTDRKEKFSNYFIITFSLIIQSPMLFFIALLSSGVIGMVILNFAGILFPLYIGFFIFLTNDLYLKFTTKNCNNK